MESENASSDFDRKKKRHNKTRTIGFFLTLPCSLTNTTKLKNVLNFVRILPEDILNIPVMSRCLCFTFILTLLGERG